MDYITFISACRHNDAVLPWEWQQGCADPSCGAQLSIIDSWDLGNKKYDKKNFGFVGLIKLPKKLGFDIT